MEDTTLSALEARQKAVFLNAGTRQRKGKQKADEGKIQITRQESVDQIVEISTIPSTWPVPHTPTAYLINLSNSLHLLKRGNRTWMIEFVEMSAQRAPISFPSKPSANQSHSGDRVALLSIKSATQTQKCDSTTPTPTLLYKTEVNNVQLAQTVRSTPQPKQPSTFNPTIRQSVSQWVPSRLVISKANCRGLIPEPYSRHAFFGFTASSPDTSPRLGPTTRATSQSSSVKFRHTRSPNEMDLLPVTVESSGLDKKMWLLTKDAIGKFQSLWPKLCCAELWLRVNRPWINELDDEFKFFTDTDPNPSSELSQYDILGISCCTLCFFSAYLKRLSVEELRQEAVLTGCPFDKPGPIRRYQEAKGNFEHKYGGTFRSEDRNDLLMEEMCRYCKIYQEGVETKDLCEEWEIVGRGWYSFSFLNHFPMGMDESITLDTDLQNKYHQIPWNVNAHSGTELAALQKKADQGNMLSSVPMEESSILKRNGIELKVTFKGDKNERHPENEPLRLIWKRKGSLGRIEWPLPSYILPTTNQGWEGELPRSTGT
ncbi:hypothetical protein K438DRAFT_1757767 [Mycena galopus ATCC 62051]|nr:hypothetical protein K438DRAFT_1757767 [Mycena galopus ATCC 62051]